jgi:hypothetical protein
MISSFGAKIFCGKPAIYLALLTVEARSPIIELSFASSATGPNVRDLSKVNS